VDQRGNPASARSVETARQLLKSAGYSWNSAGQLLDSRGRPVEFSIVTSSSNSQRMKMATLLQEDLAHLGMQVHVVPLEFRALIDRVFQSFDYDAAIMGLGGGDADPNPEMNVWTYAGTSHLWHLGEAQPATDWERELDQLMQQQMVTLDYAKRKQLYDRAQQLIAENLPFIFLGTPNILASAMQSRGQLPSGSALILTRCGTRTNFMFAVRLSRTRECDDRNRNQKGSGAAR
jgi:peptide/nickel transport system substrate-binding protein